MPKDSKITVELGTKKNDWTSHFKSAFSRSHAPDDLKRAAAHICSAFNIQGIADPTYIVNVIAKATGRGDGAGKFYGKEGSEHAMAWLKRIQNKSARRKKTINQLQRKIQQQDLKYYHNRQALLVSMVSSDGYRDKLIDAEKEIAALRERVRELEKDSEIQEAIIASRRVAYYDQSVQLGKAISQLNALREAVRSIAAYALRDEIPSNDRTLRAADGYNKIILEARKALTESGGGEGLGTDAVNTESTGSASGDVPNGCDSDSATSCGDPPRNDRTAALSAIICEHCKGKGYKMTFRRDKETCERCCGSGMTG